MVMERIKAIADTGFVVAFLNREDASHQAAKAIYVQQRSIVLPQTVLAEVAYLVGKAAGGSAVATFLQGMGQSRFRLMALEEPDVVRTAEILQTYADSRIDFMDATVMAERLGIVQVLTLDRRDFRLFQPRHCVAFELLPYDAHPPA
jgi:uncharacterized protein